jgi:hypothetical protein
MLIKIFNKHPYQAFCTPNQLIFSTDTNDFVPADKFSTSRKNMLENRDFKTLNDKFNFAGSIHPSREVKTVYTLTAYPYKNFFIEQDDILVHNHTLDRFFHGGSEFILAERGIYNVVSEKALQSGNSIKGVFASCT